VSAKGTGPYPFDVAFVTADGNPCRATRCCAPLVTQPTLMLSHPATRVDRVEGPAHSSHPRRGFGPAAFRVVDSRAVAGELTAPFGLINPVVQRTFKVVTMTASEGPAVTLTAIGQVNKNGAYAINLSRERPGNFVGGSRS